MKKILFYAGSVLSLLLIAGTAFASFYPSGGTTYRLQSSIGSADTTVNLSSFNEPVSNTPYTMSYLNSTVECGTLDPQTSKSEFISFTGIVQGTNGVQLTGVSRGLGRSYPYAASTTLASAHAGGSIFILSDAPCLFNQYAGISNVVNVTGTWSIVDPTAPTNIANKEYVDGKTFGGIGNASETATGTVQIATGAQAAAGTTNGSLGRLVIPASLATSTYNSATAGNKSIVTGVGGFIDPGFISNLSTGTTMGTTFPIGFERTVLTNTGTSTFSVPAGVTRIHVTACGAGTAGGDESNSSNITVGPGGGAGGCADGNVNVTGSSTIQYYISPGGVSTSSPAQWSSFGTNCFFLCGLPGVTVATTSATNGGFNGSRGGLATGGDINIAGQPGGAGYFSATPVANAYYPSGQGGSCAYGSGGPSRSSSISAAADGLAAAGFCSGGGGSIGVNSGAIHYGGAGSQGIIILTY